MTYDVIVIMGVAGCGKSTVAEKVAARLGAPFIEADKLHPPENVDKMKGGTPLTDEDRLPWLLAVHKVLLSSTHPAVLACSVLKKSYRNLLSDGLRTLFVLLDVERSLLVSRLESRPGHFFPVSLLDSQLATLERPSQGESTLIIPVTVSTTVERTVDTIVNAVIAK